VDPFSFGNKTVIKMYLLLGLLMSTEHGFFPSALPQIREYFGIGYTKGGVLGSVCFFGICISTPVFGWMANSTPPVKMTLVGLLVYVGSLMGSSISGDYYIMVVFRLFQSFGEAAVWSVGPVIIDLIAKPDRRAMWNSIFIGNTWLGFSVGQIIGGIVIDHTWVYWPQSESWRIVLIFQAILGAILLPSFLMLKGPKNILCIKSDRVVDSDSVLQKTMLILHNKTYLHSCICFTIITSMIQGAGYYLIEFIQDVFQVTAMKAGATVGILLGTTVIFGIFTGGIILDCVIKSSSKGGMRTCSLMEMCKIATKLTCISLSLVAFAAPFISFRPFINQLTIFCCFFSFIMLGVSLSIGPIANTILWSVELKDRSFAKALSNVFANIFGRVPAPVIVGYLKEIFGWRWTFFYSGSHVFVALVFIAVAHYHAKKTALRLKISTIRPSFI